MEILVNNKSYTIDYTCYDDTYGDCYSIFLIDKEGKEHALSMFPNDIQLRVEALVDQDVYENSKNYSEYTYGNE
jgi:hypothetical protein